MKVHHYTPEFTKKNTKNGILNSIFVSSFRRSMCENLVQTATEIEKL